MATELPASLSRRHFRLLLLGPFALYRDGVPLDTSRWRRSVASLLKLLATAPQWRRSRDELIDILWPEATPEAGASNLRTTMLHLRRALGGGDPSPVLSERGWISLNRAYTWDIDLNRFEELTRVAEQSEADNSSELLEEALGLYRGEPLPEDRYDDWAVGIRERTQRAWRDACLRLAAWCHQSGSSEAAIHWYEWVLESDPLDEEALRGLLLALGDLGRRTEAVRRYQRFEQLLKQEMDLAPGAETVAAVDKVKAQAGAGLASEQIRTPNRTPVVGENAVLLQLEQPPTKVQIQAETEAAPWAHMSRLVEVTKRVSVRRSALAAVAAALLVVLVVLAFALLASSNSSTAAPSKIGRLVPHWRTGTLLSGTLKFPSGVAVDGQGNVYVADRGTDRISKFAPTGRLLLQWGTGGSGTGEVLNPHGLALDRQGNVYVADTGIDRIQKFSSTGRPLAAWGTSGSKPGQFLAPYDVAVDARGYVYVSDTGNNRIQKLSPSGRPVAIWGSEGSGPEQLKRPDGLAVDAGGAIFVADAGNNRLQEFSAAGARTVVSPEVGITALAVDTRGHIYCVAHDSFIDQISRSGNIFPGLVGVAPPGRSGKPGSIDRPEGLAVDGQGNFYVADTWNHRIQKFSPTGVLQRIWGSAASHVSPLRLPEGLAVDERGNLYTGDVGNNDIRKFSASGFLLGVWSTRSLGGAHSFTPVDLAVDARGNVYSLDSASDRVQKRSSEGRLLTAWGGYGTGPGQLDTPGGLAVDGAGNVYVSDTGNGRIQKFSSSGRFLVQWPSLKPATAASPRGLYASPSGLAVDHTGDVFVVDSVNDFIVKFSSTGRVLDHWGIRGSRPGQFRSPQAVTVNQHGNIYVADTGNNRIQLLSPEGKVLDVVGRGGSRAGQFTRPSGLAVDAKGNLYVADTDNNRIQKFSAAG